MRPTAIYRPIERDVLLTDGHSSIAVKDYQASDIARELASAETAVPHSARPLTLHLYGIGGRLNVEKADFLHLACEIDHALAVPTIAAAMLDDAQCR